MQIIVNHPNKASEVYKTSDVTYVEAIASVKMLQNCFPMAKIKIKR